MPKIIRHNVRLDKLNNYQLQIINDNFLCNEDDLPYHMENWGGSKISSMLLLEAIVRIDLWESEHTITMPGTGGDSVPCNHITPETEEKLKKVIDMFA